MINKITESILIGCILNDVKALRLAQDYGLSYKHFVNEKMGKIYQVISNLDKEKKEIENVIVIESCISHKIINNPIEIINLSTNAPVTTNHEHYIKEVLEGYKLNKISIMLSELQKPLLSGSIDSDSVIAKIDSTILDINKDDSQGMKSGIVLASELLDRLEKLIEGEDVGAISSGYLAVDKMSKFHPNDLIILGGRPAMGKTALALNFVLKAISDKKSVAVFSLEMSSDQISARLTSVLGRINAKKFRSGDFDDDEQDRLMYAIKKLHTMNKSLHVDDTPSITLEKIRTRCLNLSKSVGLDFVVIDYLQLMGSTGNENRERQLSQISGGLKSLAKELNVPILALCQVNRGVEQRTNKRPVMSDLRESGGIEQDADMIMFVYRDGYYNPDNDNGLTELIVSKNRHGELGNIELYFDHKRMQFKEPIND